MARDIMTDEQVEQEILRLQSSELVKLARKEENIKCQRRQRMYQLRYWEKRGKQLAAAGYTLDNIAERMLGDLSDIDEVEEHERKD